MSTELARYHQFEELQSIAKTFALSAYFDAKGSDPVSVARTLTKILAGQEYGIGPYASLKGIYIIQGQTSVSAHTIAGAIKRSPKYDYRIRQSDASVCRIEFFERNEAGKLESAGVQVFTAEDAKRAGTQNMQKWPEAMLFNRCISAGYKKFCPDVFDGGAPVYTPEELGAEVNEAGDYIEGTARVVEPATGEILNGHQPQPERPIWQTWKGPQAAIDWAADAGLDGAHDAYTALKAAIKPKAAAEMYEAWHAHALELLAAQNDPDQPALVTDAGVMQTYK